MAARPRDLGQRSTHSSSPEAIGEWMSKQGLPLELHAAGAWAVGDPTLPFRYGDRLEPAVDWLPSSWLWQIIRNGGYGK
jgi:hypothetical protein